MEPTKQELEQINAVHLLSHPARAIIIRLLKELGRAYTAQIAEALGLSQRLVAFHLSILSTSGFVESEYGLSKPSEKPPRLVRYYQLTDKVAKALNEFAKGNYLGEMD